MTEGHLAGHTHQNIQSGGSDDVHTHHGEEIQAVGIGDEEWQQQNHQRKQRNGCGADLAAAI